VYGCGELSAAVLARSEAGVDRILKRHPCTKQEQNDLGQTPLHLSAGWLWGVNRLHEAEAPVDAADRNGLRPIDYALTFDCPSTVEKLLKAGSALDDLWRVFDRIGGQQLESFSALVNALAGRRRELAALAKGVLSSTDYAMLVGSGVDLPDRTAYDLYQRITDCGISLRPALRVHRKHISVYHYNSHGTLTLEKLNILYDAGFHDVDTQDSKGATPLIIAAVDLQYSNDTSVCEQLILKGADLFKKITATGTSPLHFLALGVGNCAARTIKKVPKAVPAGSERLKFLAQSFANLTGLKLGFQEDYLETTDNCICACSVYGCSFLSVLLKECSRVSYRRCISCWIESNRIDCLQSKQAFLAHYNSFCQGARVLFLHWVLEAVYGQQQIPDTVADSVTRSLLFVDLAAGLMRSVPETARISVRKRLVRYVKKKRS